MTEDKQIIYEFLQKNDIFTLDKPLQFIEVTKLVSQIPWGEGRSIEEAIVTKKVGTCTGKHLVLQACYDALAIEYRPVVCTFRWDEQKIRYPGHLQKILNEGSWEHGHNFVQVNVEGTWMDVDVMWDSHPKLKEAGCAVFPLDWDGKTPVLGLDKIVQRWDGADMPVLKTELIKKLTPEIKERRERFLKGFIEWIDSLR